MQRPPDTYYADFNTRHYEWLEKWKAKGLEVTDAPAFQEPYPPERITKLQPRRDAILDKVHSIFWRLDKVELSLGYIKITSDDQGGHPFVPLEIKFQTGHTEEFFYDAILSVLQAMQDENDKIVRGR